jgi:ubiquinone/menaquinone biosynthesis C-methylase UbiE
VQRKSLGGEGEAYRFVIDMVGYLLGRVLKGGAASSCLPASVRRFPGQAELSSLLAQAGSAGGSYRTFAGGIVALQTGVAA